MGLALANLLLAAYLAGVIWVVQVVHYPLFAAVGRGAWSAYEESHRQRITVVVALPMLLQLPLAVLLLPGALAWANLLCVAVAFGTTMAWLGPMHGPLQARWDPALHRRLVRGNWVRTAAWTAQAGLACALVAGAA
jgi:hypothetical protein